jgi:hypothetical protein
MKSYIVVVMLAVLLLSVVVLSGCKGREPEPEPQANHEGRKDVKQQAKAEENPEAEKAALEAAESWLKLMDAGKYTQTWEEAAEYVKALVNREKWQNDLQGVRKPLGKIVSRDLKSTHYTTSAPGAPDGQYVIIQYNTSFENKKSAVETITPMLEKDGKWKVSGYYIR